MTFERIFHVNVNVRDLDRSVAFYRDVLGMNVVEGPFDGEGPAMAGIALGTQAYGVQPDQVKIRAAFLRYGDDENATIIDLLEFRSPPPMGGPYPSLHNVGIARIALKVSDIDEAYGHLVANGVQFVSEPVGVNIGDDLLAGIRYCCFYDPDGTILEIYG